MRYLVYKIFILFLTLSVGTFCKSTISLVSKTNVQRQAELEETEVEKEVETESKDKSDNGHSSGPDLDHLIEAHNPLNFPWFVNSGRKFTNDNFSVSRIPFYLLYHNLKLDCPF